MLVTLIDAPASMAQTGFAIGFGIGEMQFGARDTCVLLLALAAALSSSFSLWRLGQSEDRQKRLLDALRRTPHSTEKASLASRPPWHQRLGMLVASSRILSTAERQRLLNALVAAGVKGHGRLSALIAVKVCATAAFLPLCWLFLEWHHHFFVGAPTIRLLLFAAAAVLGWHFPEVVLSRLAARRRVRLESGMPDALDLLVICAGAGLSLDHAIEQVSRVLRHSNPEVAEEFASTAAEMRVSPVRSQALENLAQRVGIASLRSIANRSNSARH